MLGPARLERLPGNLLRPFRTNGGQPCGGSELPTYLPPLRIRHLVAGRTLALGLPASGPGQLRDLLAIVLLPLHDIGSLRLDLTLGAVVRLGDLPIHRTGAVTADACLPPHTPRAVPREPPQTVHPLGHLGAAMRQRTPHASRPSSGPSGAASQARHGLGNPGCWAQCGIQTVTSSPSNDRSSQRPNSKNSGDHSKREVIIVWFDAVYL